MFPMPESYDISKHGSPTIKLGLQFFFRKEDGFKYAQKKACVVYSTQEIFYPTSEKKVSTSFFGILYIYI